jgi:RNA polymerase subunit RPABC4/transcription elongation factor Spt4
MNWLRREFGVAARRGVAISAALAFVAALLFVLVIHEPPFAVRIALGAAMAVFVFLYGFLVSYVYGDAKRRGMRHGLWALVAACVPNALGFIAYFLLREPLLQPCGACGTLARRDFAFCPQCGSPLRRVCRACRRPVETAWSHCAHCGAALLEDAK